MAKKDIEPGTPIKAGDLGYYESNGKQVPIQKFGCPFTDVNCAHCGKPAPHPLEFGGGLFCSDWCAKKKLGNHPNLNQDPEYWAKAERVEGLKEKMEKVKAELEKEGVTNV